MFEQLFGRTIGSIGATSGSANFRETSAVVGDTIHADFTWSNAQYHFVGECYATMYIYDPNNNPVTSYIEGASYSGSKTLSAVADMVGDWKAVLKVWNGNTWLEYPDTINVSSADGATRWEIAVIPGEQHEHWITQRMIDVVGSNKADVLFANIDPPDAQVTIFQQDATGNWKSWVSNIPGNTLDIVSTDFPIIVGGEEPSIIIIGITGEGLGTIVDVDAPSSFTPDTEFEMYVSMRNDGEEDRLFVRLTDVDTGAILKEFTTTYPTPSGNIVHQQMLVTLQQTTDFHGRIDVGHLE